MTNERIAVISFVTAVAIGWPLTMAISLLFQF
jgi:hypothetical protein